MVKAVSEFSARRYSYVAHGIDKHRLPKVKRSKFRSRAYNLHKNSTAYQKSKGPNSVAELDAAVAKVRRKELSLRKARGKAAKRYDIPFSTENYGPFRIT